MRSKIKLMMVLFCTLSVLGGCASNTRISATKDETNNNSSGSREDESMKHEIVTITQLFDDYLVVTNNKEEYIIFGYQKYNVNFEIGNKIGVSYTEKVQNEDGMYVISALKITKERTISILPREK